MYASVNMFRTLNASAYMFLCFQLVCFTASLRSVLLRVGYHPRPARLTLCHYKQLSACFQLFPMRCLLLRICMRACLSHNPHFENEI